MKAHFKRIGTSLLMVPLVFVFANTNYVSADSVVEKETIIYHCEAVAAGIVTDEFEMPVTIESTVPTSVSPGEEFNLTNSSATVAIPEETVSLFNDLLFWNVISGEVDTFEVHSENEDGTVNVADPTLDIPITDVPESGDLEFTVPEEDGVDAGPFTAGQEGEVVITAGTIFAELENPSSILPITIDADCEPLEEIDGEEQDITLTSISIIEN